MMKFAVTVLFLFLALNPSQAKMTSVERVFIFHKRSVLKNQTVTRNVLVHAIPRTHKRLLITANLIDDENDDPPGPDELDLHQGYRRPELIKDLNHDSIPDDLSEYIQVRLAVARARAMARYRQLHT